MKKKKASASDDGQILLDFEKVIQSAKVSSKDEVAASKKHPDPDSYDPFARTADYMFRSVKYEEAWETTIRKAREKLMQKDPRALYLEFFTDMKRLIEQNSPKSERLADLLKQVAIRGLGMTDQHISIRKPQKGSIKWRVTVFDTDAIKAHLEKHIIGKCFLNPVENNSRAWGEKSPIVGASDVSQHSSFVPVPARFFKNKVPFVLNNAAGTIFKMKGNKTKYEILTDPNPDDELLRWMLIDPSYADELEAEDYKRCLASAMDVGQYRFDFKYLLSANPHIPDVIFRDGSLFPQDAYIDNYVAQSKRGDFTREAIQQMYNCLLKAADLNVIYCGVSKAVQLKVYSAVVDWFISTQIDRTWEAGNYTLNDGQAMSLLLSSPDFVATTLSNTISTCLIYRSFTTRAALNEKADLNNLDSFFQPFEAKHEIREYRQLCKIAHVYMFFIGHARSPELQLPRYEFFYDPRFGDPNMFLQKILSALQNCGFTNDNDHSFMSADPITYLIPSVTQHAHLLSKDVGKYISSSTGQRIMARYRSLISNSK